MLTGQPCANRRPLSKVDAERLSTNHVLTCPSTSAGFGATVGKPIRMQAKFAGTCRECRQPIPVGADMLWWPSTRPAAATHPLCVVVVVPPPAQRAPSISPDRPRQTPNAAMRAAFPAKYSGRCKTCNVTFAPGEPIARHPTGGGFQHSQCAVTSAAGTTGPF